MPRGGEEKAGAAADGKRAARAARARGACRGVIVPGGQPSFDKARDSGSRARRGEGAGPSSQVEAMAAVTVQTGEEKKTRNERGSERGRGLAGGGERKKNSEKESSRFAASACTSSPSHAMAKPAVRSARSARAAASSGAA